VRDDQGRAAVRSDEPFEPAERVEVEMIRRLVEEEDLRLGKQQPGKAESGLLSSGEGRYWLVGIEVAKAEALQHLLGPLLPLVAAKSFETSQRRVVRGQGGGGVGGGRQSLGRLSERFFSIDEIRARRRDRLAERQIRKII
jgi:hypothetical protein